jgi:hypothetical protein
LGPENVYYWIDPREITKGSIEEREPLVDAQIGCDDIANNFMTFVLCCITLEITNNAETNIERRYQQVHFQCEPQIPDRLS